MSESTSRPELQFFVDPAVDRLMGVVFSLAGEVQVLRDRLQVLEAVLDERKLVEAGVIDRYTPTAAQQSAMDADRRAYTRHIFDPMLGRAASRSAVGVGTLPKAHVASPVKAGDAAG